MQKNGQRQKEITEFVFSWKILLAEIFLFYFALTLGIVTGFKMNELSEQGIIFLPQISFWQFVLQLFFAALFIFFVLFLIRKQKKKKTIYKMIFILAVWWGGTIVFSMWLPSSLALVLMGSLVFWWHKHPLVLNHNICIILGLAGTGAAVGLRFTPLTIVLILVLFSIYDFIAVYKTKHMIKMAKEMIEHKAILALIIPRSISGFGKSLEEVKIGGATRKFLILGGGDVVFPLLLCVSLLPQGIIYSFIVAVFSLMGLLLSFWILMKTRQPVPALPPIALFSIIGFLITLLFDILK